ncbi:MAG: creatininase family protein [Thermodesulfobacteriota bacterium]
MNEADLARLPESLVALLPLGSMEPHAHLPLATDTLIAAAILAQVAAGTPHTCLFPAIPVGFLFKYAGWPGAIGVGHQILTGLIVDICRGLSRLGLRKLLLMSGHDENREPALQALREAHRESGVLGVYCDWIELAVPVVSRISASGREGHASEIQTSVFLHLFPQMPVDLPRPALQPLGPPPRGADDLFASPEQGTWVRAVPLQHGRSCTGDPGQATPEKGKIVVEAIVQQARKIIEDLRAIQD